MNLLKKANAKYWAVTAAACGLMGAALPSFAQTADMSAAIASSIDDGVNQVKGVATTNGPKLFGVAVVGVLIGIGIKYIRKLRGAA